MHSRPILLVFFILKIWKGTYRKALVCMIYQEVEYTMAIRHIIQSVVYGEIARRAPRSSTWVGRACIDRTRSQRVVCWHEKLDPWAAGVCTLLQVCNSTTTWCMAEVTTEVRRRAEQTDHPSATLTRRDIDGDSDMLTPVNCKTNADIYCTSRLLGILVRVKR